MKIYCASNTSDEYLLELAKDISDYKGLEDDLIAELYKPFNSQIKYSNQNETEGQLIQVNNQQSFDQITSNLYKEHGIEIFEIVIDKNLQKPLQANSLTMESYTEQVNVLKRKKINEIFSNDEYFSQKHTDFLVKNSLSFCDKSKSGRLFKSMAKADLGTEECFLQSKKPRNEKNTHKNDTSNFIINTTNVNEKSSFLCSKSNVWEGISDCFHWTSYTEKLFDPQKYICLNLGKALMNTSIALSEKSKPLLIIESMQPQNLMESHEQILIKNLTRLPYRSSLCSLERILKNINLSKNVVVMRSPSENYYLTKNNLYYNMKISFTEKELNEIMKEIYGINTKYKSDIDNEQTIKGKKQLYVQFLTELMYKKNEISEILVFKPQLFELILLMEELYFYIAWRIKDIMNKKFDKSFRVEQVKSEIDYLSELLIDFFAWKTSSRTKVNLM